MKSIHPTGLLLACSLATASGIAAAQPAADTPQASPPASSAARHSVDDSGRGRPVEHDDRIEDSRGPSSSQRSAAGAAALRNVSSRSGAMGVVLDESFMSFTVVKRNADGSISSTCVPGKERAERVMQQSSRLPRGGANETE